MSQSENPGASQQIGEAAETPGKIPGLPVGPATGHMPCNGRRTAFSLKPGGAQVRQLRQCVKLMGRLCKAFAEKDMEMPEINPLTVTTGGEPMVTDARPGFDGNAASRTGDLWIPGLNRQRVSPTRGACRSSRSGARAGDRPGPQAAFAVSYCGSQFAGFLPGLYEPLHLAPNKIGLFISEISQI